jgi:heme-degrading monooxygenase HmoA
MIVVLFRIKLRPDVDRAVYEAKGARMDELVRQVPGFISVDYYTTAEGEEGVIARFASEEALAAWRNHPEHLETQRQGRDEFFESYQIQVCSTIREYGVDRSTNASLMGAAEKG